MFHTELFLAAVISLFIGFIIGFLLGIATSYPDGKNACRAANPGYECDLGWTRSEPFQ